MPQQLEVRLRTISYAERGRGRERDEHRKEKGMETKKRKEGLSTKDKERKNKQVNQQRLHFTRLLQSLLIITVTDYKLAFGHLGIMIL